MKQSNCQVPDNRPPKDQRVYELPEEFRPKKGGRAEKASVEAEVAGSNPVAIREEVHQATKGVAQSVERRRPPVEPKKPKTDAIVYTRNREAWNAYMVDWRAAKKVGLSVKDYRARRKERGG